MDTVHLHLMLNHIPVTGVILGLIILAWGILRPSDEVKVVGLVGLILTALVAVPVYLTGEPAQETIENLAGVSENVIELHENSATLSLVFAMIAGGLALISLLSKRARSPAVARMAIIGTLLVSAVTTVLMARTANLGGQIRHTEIRGSGPTVESQNPSKTKQRDREDDDH